MKRRCASWAILAAALSLASCAEKVQADFILRPSRPLARSTFIIFPLQNFSGYGEAALQAEGILAEALQKQGVPKIISAAQLRQELLQQRIPLELVERRLALRLGREQRADYAVLGAVLDWQERKMIARGRVRGDESSLSLEIQVVDLLRGSIIYSSMMSWSEPLGLSFRGQAIDQELRQLVRQLINPLFERGAG